VGRDVGVGENRAGAQYDLVRCVRSLTQITLVNKILAHERFIVFLT